MIDVLKTLKFKTLPTLNQLVKKVKNLDYIKDYAKFLDQIPKRTDFISFDEEGFALNDNSPIFKGWTVCESTSSQTKKVAKHGDNRVYFDVKEGVVIMNVRNICDNVTYNDLAIFFEGNLKLK